MSNNFVDFRLVIVAGTPYRPWEMPVLERCSAAARTQITANPTSVTTNAPCKLARGR